MSASKKLRALVHDMGYGGLERTQSGSLVLVRALPQILAVVEAAEEHQIAARAHWKNQGNKGEPLPLREYAVAAAALAALEEALS